jgi:hypothetical protein
MKIRTGFVSNSSSSSFLIYGVGLNEAQVQALAGENIPKYANPESVVETLATREGLIVDRHPNYGFLYVGASWDTVGEDETARQFKARVKEALGRMGIFDECGTHTEAWYDG